MRFDNSLEIRQNELLEPIYQLVDAELGSLIEGQFFYNKALKRPAFYDGTSCRYSILTTEVSVSAAIDSIPRSNNLGKLDSAYLKTGAAGDIDVAKLGGNLPAYYLKRSNHTGVQNANTIEDFTSAVINVMDGHGHLLGDISNSIALRARRATTTQSISSATYTKVQYNGVDYDIGSCYSTSNFRITPPTNQSQGIYHIIAAVSLSGTSIGRLVLYKNGVAYQILYYGSAANNYFYGSTDIQLLPTDYLEIYIYCNTARSIAITNSFVSMHSLL